jgi:hypothetical protein
MRPLLPYAEHIISNLRRQTKRAQRNEMCLKSFMCKNNVAVMRSNSDIGFPNPALFFGLKKVFPVLKSLSTMP